MSRYHLQIFDSRTHPPRWRAASVIVDEALGVYWQFAEDVGSPCVSDQLPLLVAVAGLMVKQAGARTRVFDVVADEVVFDSGERHGLEPPMAAGGGPSAAR